MVMEMSSLVTSTSEGASSRVGLLPLSSPFILGMLGFVLLG